MITERHAPKGVICYSMAALEAGHQAQIWRICIRLSII